MTNEQPQTASPVQKPSVGRIVHYTAKPGAPCFAAIITAVDEQSGFCILTVFRPDSPTPMFARARQQVSSVLEHNESNPAMTDPQLTLESWHFPERV